MIRGSDGGIAQGGGIESGTGQVDRMSFVLNKVDNAGDMH